MIGAAVVLLLGGLMIPIVMLFAAVVFDLFLVTWVVFHEWHDDWSSRLARMASRMASRARHPWRFRSRPKHAH